MLNTTMLNTTFNLCKNCIYFKPNYIIQESRCLKFGKKHPGFEFAINCRKDETKCGKYGWFFINNCK